MNSVICHYYELILRAPKHVEDRFIGRIENSINTFDVPKYVDATNSNPSLYPSLSETWKMNAQTVSHFKKLISYRYSRQWCYSFAFYAILKFGNIKDIYQFLYQQYK